MNYSVHTTLATVTGPFFGGASCIFRTFTDSSSLSVAYEVSWIFSTGCSLHCWYFAADCRSTRWPKK